jgi:hypothetical protein
VVTTLVCFCFYTRGYGCAKHPAFPAPSPRKRSRLSRPRGTILEAKTRAGPAAGMKICDHQPVNFQPESSVVAAKAGTPRERNCALIANHRVSSCRRVDLRCSKGEATAYGPCVRVWGATSLYWTGATRGRGNCDGAASHEQTGSAIWENLALPGQSRGSILRRKRSIRIPARDGSQRRLSRCRRDFPSRC